MHIPVLDSILSPIALTDLIKKNYGLSRSACCAILRTGVNHTYHVKDQDKQYVFRVYSYNWRSRKDIEEELKLLNLLFEKGISVSIPILALDQEFIQELQAPEGLRFGVLFSFAKGEKIRELTPKACYNIGVTMGAFHAVTENLKMDRATYSPDNLTHQAYQYALQYFEPDTEAMRFVKKAANLYTDKANAGIASFREGIVHLDMWYDNMNIDQQSSVTVFDFDFCGNGWLLLDLAYFVMQLYHTEPDSEQYALKLEEFYSGYRQKASLSDQEKAFLPYAGMAIWIFYLGVQASRFDNWSNVFYTKNYLKHYVGLLKKWMQFNGIVLE